jgi:primosomal protein N'
MTGTSITVAGIEIPSTNLAFLAIVAVHVLFGLACTITGIIAMLSPKRSGRHPWFGTIYYWCLTGVFLTACALAAVRWAEDYHLFILGTLAFAAASLGRRARRKRWSQWVKLHITGMGTSYILLLTAFYVTFRRSRIG